MRFQDTIEQRFDVGSLEVEYRGLDSTRLPEAKLLPVDKIAMTSKHISILVAASAILSIAAAPNSRVLRGKVTSITDGDTIKVLDAENREHKIRLDAIDAHQSDLF